MFTAAPYSLAFLMAVGAVALYKKRTVTGCFSAAVLLILSLSIYQSYIALTASFFVILLFQELLERKTEVRVILCRGIRMVIFLLVILVLYYASIRIAMVLTNTEYNDYASNNFKTESINLFGRVYVAYVNFMYFFTSGNWGLINTVPSLVMHLTAILVTGMTVLYHVRKLKVSQIVLLIALVAAFVLSVNCMYLVTSEEAIHTLVLYSFVAVYVLLTVALEAIPLRKFLVANIVTIALAIVIINNLIVSNQAYLQMHFAYERATSFFSGIITQIQMTPGYDENSVVALVGEYDSEEVYFPHTERITGVSEYLLNINSREEFLRYYFGFEAPFATAEDMEKIVNTEEFQKMPLYPYYGSIQKIDNYVIVKLGTPEIQD